MLLVVSSNDGLGVAQVAQGCGVVARLSVGQELWNCQCGQNANDGYNYHQFNEGKAKRVNSVWHEYSKEMWIFRLFLAFLFGIFAVLFMQAQCQKKTGVATKDAILRYCHAANRSECKEKWGASIGLSYCLYLPQSKSAQTFQFFANLGKNLGQADLLKRQQGTVYCV